MWIRYNLQNHNSYLDISIFHKTYCKLNSKILLPVFLDKKHYQSLDGWRAIGIALVVLGHAKYTVEKSSLYYFFAENFIYAELGVRIFFILSGFLITTLLLKELVNKGKINIPQFFINRALRIFPVLYLYITVILALNFHYRLDINYLPFIGSLLYFTNFILSANTWLTGHTWSLSLEEQFYAVWPLVLTFLKRKAWIFCTLIILSAPLLRILWHLSGSYYKTLGPFIDGADGIFMGTMISIISFKGLIKTTSKYWSNYLLHLFAILLIFFCYYFSHKGMLVKFLVPFGRITSDLAICYLMLATIINKKGIIVKILNNPIVVKIGIISYSLYIWQQLFLLPFSYYPNILPRAIFPINIIISSMIAFMSYYFYEIHFLKLKKKFL